MECAQPNFILVITLGGTYSYYFYFMGGEIEAQRG